MELNANDKIKKVRKFFFVLFSAVMISSGLSLLQSNNQRFFIGGIVPINSCLMFKRYFVCLLVVVVCVCVFM